MGIPRRTGKNKTTIRRQKRSWPGLGLSRPPARSPFSRLTFGTPSPPDSSGRYLGHRRRLLRFNRRRPRLDNTGGGSSRAMMGEQKPHHSTRASDPSCETNSLIRLPPKSHRPHPAARPTSVNLYSDIPQGLCQGRRLSGTSARRMQLRPPGASRAVLEPGHLWNRATQAHSGIAGLEDEPARAAGGVGAARPVRTGIPPVAAPRPTRCTNRARLLRRRAGRRRRRCSADAVR